MKNQLPLSHCQKVLLTLWMTGFVVITILLLVQTSKPYEEGGDLIDWTVDAWRWFLPTIIPIITIIFGALFHDIFRGQEKIMVEKLPYKAALIISTIYLLLLLYVVSIDGMHPGLKPPERLETFTIPVTMLQGLVGIAIGAFFVSRAVQSSTSDNPSA